MVRATVVTAVCLLVSWTVVATLQAQAPAGGATGTIVGIVLDASSGDPIIEAGVEVIGAGVKTRTDLDGKYSLKVPAGNYEVRVFAPLYQGTRLRNVVVAEAKETRANASLKPEGDAAIEVVEVVAEAKKAAEATQLLQRKMAPVVSDNIGAEEVKKSPDSNASEVVQRLPSITISEDKFVFVRGLGERYSLGVLNGSRLPSINPDKRVVPLDIFPADFIDAINIYKSYAPNMPGDACALIDISLKDPPDRLTYGIGLSSSVDTQTTFESFDSYKGGRYDYFGFGADYRTPDDLPSLTHLKGGARQRAAAGLFRNIWNVDSETAPPDFDLNFNLGNAWGPLSFSFAGKYKNEHQARDELIGDIPNATSQTQVNYKRSQFDTELGAILTAAWKIAPEHKLNLRTFVQQYSQDEVLTGSGNSEVAQERRVFPTVLEYEQGKLGVGQLTGAHHFGWVDVDWRSALAQTTRVLPDRRFYRYQQSIESTGAPEIDSQPPSLLREYDNLDELLTDSSLDFTIPFATRLPMTDVWSGPPAKLQTGLAYSYRNRNYDLRRFQYELESSNGLDVTASPEELLVPNNIGTNFSFSERTTPSDTFKASQEIAALYGMVDLPIVRDRLRLIAGVRLEYSYILSEGAPIAVIGEEPATFRIPLNNLDPLPAINLVYSPRNDMNIRFGWSRTVSRPEFRELQPTFIVQPPPERPIVGNPNLISAQIDNVDLRWEWFFGDRELLSLGGFYKHMTDPIEQTTVKLGTLNANSFLNAEHAELYGFEVEGRKHFGFLAPLLKRAAALEKAVSPRYDDPQPRINGNTHAHPRRHGNTDVDPHGHIGGHIHADDRRNEHAVNHRDGDAFAGSIRDRRAVSNADTHRRPDEHGAADAHRNALRAYRGAYSFLQSDPYRNPWGTNGDADDAGKRGLRQRLPRTWRNLCNVRARLQCTSLHGGHTLTHIPRRPHATCVPGSIVSDRCGRLSQQPGQLTWKRYRTRRPRPSAAERCNRHRQRSRLRAAGGRVSRRWIAIRPALPRRFRFL